MATVLKIATGNTKPLISWVILMRIDFFLSLLLAAMAATAAASEFSPRAAELALARHEKTSDGGKRYLTVRTNAPHNREVKFFYHVPAGYDPAAGRKYRVLVYFGGRNCSGEAEAGDKLGFAAWGDAHDVFIVGPGFRDDEYWRPERWSGKALADAMALLGKMYNVKKDRLLFYGYSAGSQCANLFAAHFAAQTVAYVAHGCGVFHAPSPKMRQVPGVVTCGDADVARYVISRRFVRECREMGVNVIFKSLPNHPHDVPPDSVRLAKEFLLYHHRRTAAELRRDDAPVPEEKASLVGDDVDGVYYPADDPRVRFIEPRDRVFFSSRAVADAWGRPAPAAGAARG